MNNNHNSLTNCKKIRGRAHVPTDNTNIYHQTTKFSRQFNPLTADKQINNGLRVRPRPEAARRRPYLTSLRTSMLITNATRENMITILFKYAKLR